MLSCQFHPGTGFSAPCAIPCLAVAVAVRAVVAAGALYWRAAGSGSPEDRDGAGRPDQWGCRTAASGATPGLGSRRESQLPDVPGSGRRAGPPGHPPRRAAHIWRGRHPRWPPRRCPGGGERPSPFPGTSLVARGHQPGTTGTGVRVQPGRAPGGGGGRRSGGSLPASEPRRLALWQGFGLGSKVTQRTGEVGDSHLSPSPPRWDMTAGETWDRRFSEADWPSNRTRPWWDVSMVCHRDGPWTWAAAPVAMGSGWLLAAVTSPDWTFPQFRWSRPVHEPGQRLWISSCRASTWPGQTLRPRAALHRGGPAQCLPPNPRGSDREDPTPAAGGPAGSRRGLLGVAPGGLGPRSPSQLKAATDAPITAGPGHACWWRSQGPGPRRKGPPRGTEAGNRPGTAWLTIRSLIYS
jgi:hypothetical protein